MILLIGGGGHCRSVISVIKKIDKNWERHYGIVDNKFPSNHTFIMGIPVLGTDKDLPKLLSRQRFTYVKLAEIDKEKHSARFVDEEKKHIEPPNYTLITVGSVNSEGNKKRKELYEKIKELGFLSPTIISPDAVIGELVEVKEGTVILSNAVLNTNAIIGRNCIINTGAIIEHDCRIGDHVHIAPGVHMSGGVEIGKLSFVGVGSTIIQGIKIGKNVTIGAGSVVIRDVEDNAVVAGNTARRIR